MAYYDKTTFSQTCPSNFYICYRNFHGMKINMVVEGNMYFNQLLYGNIRKCMYQWLPSSQYDILKIAGSQNLVRGKHGTC